MTNTRITDAEVLERRYPVILNSFSLRPESGGNGLFRGGDGIKREVLFRKPLTLSVLTERRVCAPYGLEGGLVFKLKSIPFFHGFNPVQQEDAKEPRALTCFSDVTESS